MMPEAMQVVQYVRESLYTMQLSKGLLKFRMLLIPFISIALCIYFKVWTHT